MVKTFRKKRRGNCRTKRKYYGGGFTITLNKEDLNEQAGLMKNLIKNITIQLADFHDFKKNAINIPFDKHMDNRYIQENIDREIKKKFNKKYPERAGAHRTNGLSIKFLPKQSISLPRLRDTTSLSSPSYDSDSDGTDALSDLSTPRSRSSDGSSSRSSLSLPSIPSSSSRSSLSLPSIPSSSSNPRSTHSSGSTRGKIDPLIEQGFLPKKPSILPPFETKPKTEKEKEEEDRFTQDLFKRTPVLDKTGKPVEIGGGKSRHKKRRTFKKAAKVPSTV